MCVTRVLGCLIKPLDSSGDTSEPSLTNPPRARLLSLPRSPCATILLFFQSQVRNKCHRSGGTAFSTGPEGQLQPGPAPRGPAAARRARAGGSRPCSGRRGHTGGGAAEGPPLPAAVRRGGSPAAGAVVLNGRSGGGRRGGR